MTNKPVTLITAAGRGMGAAIAHELAAAGHDLALMSPSGAKETLAQLPGAVGLAGSVTDPADLQKLVDLAMQKFGQVDGVVNNTGHPPKGKLLEISDADWHTGLDMVVLNVVRMARLVTPIMQAQGGGAFVNISTYAAFEPEAAFPVSAALRAALAGFAKIFADEYAASNIRMNNILPGFIDSYPETDALRDRIPMRRFGKVSEIAKTARFLLSADAGYITGQNIRVDGGITKSV